MNPEQKSALLRAIPTFAAFDDAALRTLAAEAEERELEAGQVLFREGEVSAGGYVIASGELELVPGEPGAQTRRVGAGALVGELSLLVDLPRPARASATMETVLLHISRASFVQLLETRPQAALELKRELASRLDRFLGDLDEVRHELEYFRPSSRRP